MSGDHPDWWENGDPDPRSEGTRPMTQPDELYHVTTSKKAKDYRHTGCIKSPVRGFTTLMGAMAWAIKTGRKVIYKVKVSSPHKLPDHHNEFGEAWWNDGDCPDFQCVYSGDS